MSETRRKAMDRAWSAYEKAEGWLVMLLRGDPSEAALDRAHALLERRRVEFEAARDAFLVGTR